jgi:hypothetical protein
MFVMAGQIVCAMHIACLGLHGRSHCLTYVHFAYFNCLSGALYTAGQFECHVHNGGSHDLPCLLGQFKLHVKLHALCIMTGHITCRGHYVMLHCMHALVHCGKDSECTLAVPIACHIHCGRSDHLTCALCRFHCLSCAKGQVRDCLPRALCMQVTLFAMYAGHTQLILQVTLTGYIVCHVHYERSNCMSNALKSLLQDHSRGF